jgi:hypothetical protein
MLRRSTRARRFQMENAQVVACDIFAISNPLKSHAVANLLFPNSNIRAVTLKLCSRSSLTLGDFRRRE